MLGNYPACFSFRGLLHNEIRTAFLSSESLRETVFNFLWNESKKKKKKEIKGRTGECPPGNLKSRPFPLSLLSPYPSKTDKLVNLLFQNDSTVNSLRGTLTIKRMSYIYIYLFVIYEVPITKRSRT